MYYLINRLKESPDILEISLLLKTTTSYGPLLWHSIYAIVEGIEFFYVIFSRSCL